MVVLRTIKDIAMFVEIQFIYPLNASTRNLNQLKPKKRKLGYKTIYAIFIGYTKGTTNRFLVMIIPIF